MLHGSLLWLALLTLPFWEAKAPHQWTVTELQQLMRDSPWAQTMPPDGLPVYLADAAPMRQAEEEMIRRSKLEVGRKRPPLEADLDYTDFLKQDAGRHLVVAVPYPNPDLLSDASEARRMEEECVMRVGKKKYHITGQFPPTPSDPVLRLVFPKEVPPGAKSLLFELYLPGLRQPFREAEFPLKEMLYKGKLEL